MLYYYKNQDGGYTARSSPLTLENETEVSETEYDNYILTENKKHETE